MKKTLIALSLVLPMLAHATPQSCMFLNAYLAQHPEVDDVAGYKQQCADDVAKEDAKAQLRTLPNPTIGMAAKVVAEKTSWGKPDSVNKTTTRYGTNEQWVYEISGGRHSYLYFTNGKLTAAQN